MMPASSTPPYACGHPRQHSYLRTTRPEAVCPACYRARNVARGKLAWSSKAKQQGAPA